MVRHASADVRNVALLGPEAVGKTTLVEALLVASGAMGAKGSVEEGTTQSDHDPLEKKYGRSLTTSFLQLSSQGRVINLLDTPGSSDLLGESLGSLAAVETAALVVSATTGVDAYAERVFANAKARGLCRVVIVNRIDAEGADPARVLAEIQTKLGRECLPLNFVHDGKVTDCLAAENADGSLSQHKKQLVEQIVDVDDLLMQVYLEKGTVSIDELHDAFERAMREGHLVPVCFVSATKDVGVSELLTAMTRFLPAPYEANPPRFVRSDGSVMHPSADESAHVLAQVVKIYHDPFVGKLAVVRVFQGTLTRDTQLLIGAARRPVKVGHVFSIHGGTHHEIPRAIPGDLCAIAKLDDLSLGAILHDSHDEDELGTEPSHLPNPLVSLAVTAKKKSDETKLLSSLSKLAAEDPCFVVERPHDTGDLVIRGLSDFHLRLMIERLATRYHVEVDVQPPHIAYRETVGTTGIGHCRHKKQTGGAGQFAEVFLRIEPLPRGKGFRFQSEVFGGAIPTHFIPAVEKGVRQALASGVIAGYPVQDVHVVVYDGKHHPVDSKEIAFITAGRKAFIDAMQKAHPWVLEPIVELTVVVPSALLGEVASDLSSRRGRINATETRPGGQVAILGSAPLAELEGYQSFVNAVSAGVGSYSFTFSHYDPVPTDVQNRLVMEHAPRAEAAE